MFCLKNRKLSHIQKPMKHSKVEAPLHTNVITNLIESEKISTYIFLEKINENKIRVLYLGNDRC